MIDQMPTISSYIPNDAAFLDFIKDRIVMLGIIFGILKAMFPDSRILRAIGEWIEKIRMPSFGKKDKT